MRPSFLALVWICLLLVGCASDVANRYYGAATYPEKPQSEVEILRARPARDFIVIADFQSRGETPEDLQEKAAKIGADAVIVTLLGGQYDRGDQWAGQDSMSNSYSRIVGTAIKYK
ncbi:MAG: hypothetical protein WCD70_08555 [Alphaproteobacteria bacterium]